MRARNYRLMVIGNALAWLLAGLHLPTLHELSEHGWGAPMSVRIATAVLVLVGVGLLWALLGTPSGRGDGAGRGATA